MKKQRVSLIVAMARNRAIGKDGAIPWHLSDDLKRFKKLTMGRHIVMGRKTWNSLGRLLTGRHHVIISRQAGYIVPGATVVSSLGEAIKACGDDPEIFVIGGAQIYGEALPITDRIELTEIDLDVEGDTWFPPLDLSAWKETARESHTDDATGLHFDFVTLDRLAPGK